MKSGRERRLAETARVPQLRRRWPSLPHGLPREAPSQFYFTCSFCKTKPERKAQPSEGEKTFRDEALWALREEAAWAGSFNAVADAKLSVYIALVADAADALQLMTTRGVLVDLILAFLFPSVFWAVSTMLAFLVRIVLLVSKRRVPVVGIDAEADASYKMEGRLLGRELEWWRASAISLLFTVACLALACLGPHLSPALSWLGLAGLRRPAS